MVASEGKSYRFESPLMKWVLCAIIETLMEVGCNESIVIF